jgi:sensor histidine kinase YesM
MEVASEQGGGSALYQISQNLALAFNGKAHLKIESQLGVGTTIYLHIPKVAAAW